MNLQEAEKRYASDSTFASVVRWLESILHGNHLSPSEVRDAAVYAAMRVEFQRLHYGMPSITLTREEFERMWPDVARKEREEAAKAEIQYRELMRNVRPDPQ